MAMENPPFEDVLPIGNGDFPACHVSFQRVLLFLPQSWKLGPLVPKGFIFHMVVDWIVELPPKIPKKTVRFRNYRIICPEAW